MFQNNTMLITNWLAIIILNKYHIPRQTTIQSAFSFLQLYYTPQGKLPRF